VIAGRCEAQSPAQIQQVVSEIIRPLDLQSVLPLIGPTPDPHPVAPGREVEFLNKY
jgi:hypothetical protein